MRKLLLAVLLLAFSLPLFAEKSALDLLLEGRYGEAKQMIVRSNLSPRYELLYFALTEAEAARACSLYQVIAIRYPGSDCDSVARQRLDQARSMGFTVVPIAEWAQAPANATPLSSQKSTVSAPVEPAVPVVPQTIAPTPPVVTAPRVAPPAPPKSDSAKVEADTLKMVSKIPQREPVEKSVPPKAETLATAPVPTVSDQSAPVTMPAPSAKQGPAKPPHLMPKATTLQPHDKPAEPSEGHWFIQVGAFANLDNAHKLSASLQSAGYSVKLVPLEGKTKLLQVRVGGYMTRAELKPVIAQLKEKFNVPTAVVAE